MILTNTLKSVTGQVPGRDLATYLLAQIWIETAQGKSMQNHSPGNITTANEAAVNFWRPTWYTVTETSSERDKALHEEMLKGKAPRAFISFETFEDGFKHYVTTVLTRFSSIAKAATSGNATAVAEAIQKSGYCPDCEPSKTAVTLASFAQQFTQEGLFSSLPKADSGSSLLPEFSDLPAGYFSGRSVLPVLKQGDKGSAVWLWQFIVGTATDCDFGPNTAAATREFHRAHSIVSQEPVVGPHSWAAGILHLAKLSGILKS